MHGEDYAHIFCTKIFKKIYGPVNLNVPRLNARYPMRAAQQHQVATLQPKRHDEFDFLSASPSKPFADIPASAVSDIIEANVLMVPVEGAPQGEFEEIVIASIKLPDENYDTSGRDDNNVAAGFVDSGVDMDVKEEGADMSLKGAEQDADGASDSESAVDGLV